jgi:hypothetical protein
MCGKSAQYVQVIGHRGKPHMVQGKTACRLSVSDTRGCAAKIDGCRQKWYRIRLIEYLLLYLLPKWQELVLVNFP